LAKTAIGSALRDGLLEDRMIKDQIDIHEVHSVRYLEAFDFDNPVWPTSMLTYGPPVLR
jgi:hypothetical protein